jgi:rod shape-determining protein MreD
VKRVLGLLVVGTLAAMLQGAVAGFIPARFCPDLGFLIAVAIGLCWRSTAGGLVVAASLGFVADLLSGSLLGQHALLRVLAFGAARLPSRNLNLRGPLPQALFVAGLTAANAVAVGALTTFFSPGAGFGVAALGDLPAHACVNAVFAPFVTRATEVLLGRLGDEEAGRRLLRLEPRSWAA